MNQNIYDHYTSTCMLAEDDPRLALEWGKAYFRQRILPHLPSDRKTRILDCGCGYGRNLVALRQLGYEQVRGVDISPEQVAYAQKELGLTDVHCGDGADFLKNRVDCYDVILIMDVLEHLLVDESLALLAAAKSRLTPDGILVVQVPNALCPMNVYRYLDITHERSYTTRSLAQSLRLSGFSSMSFFPLLPLAYTVGGWIRAVCWAVFLGPAIVLFMWLCHGRMAGTIVTGNFLAIAHAHKGKE